MKRLLILAVVGLTVAVHTAQPQAQTPSGYLTPPKVIVDILDAEPLPGVALSPDRKTMLMTHRRSMPTLAEVASPMLRLGGSRISPLTNGPHVLNGTIAITLKDVATGAERKLALPQTGSFGASFSPDGTKIAITHTAADTIRLLVASDTSVTLATNFIGDSTPATIVGFTYTYFEDEYALASTFLRPIDFRSFSPEMGIALISRAEFRRRYPVVKTSGRPKIACLVDTNVSGSDASGTRKVILYPYPDPEYIIPYSYVTSSLAYSSAGAAQTSLSADADVPIVPLRYRHAIVYHALAHWYRDKKDDARADLRKRNMTTSCFGSG